MTRPRHFIFDNLITEKTMTQDELKRKVAEAALDYVKHVSILGVGTGSTVNHLIEMLADFRQTLDGAVSSSEGTTARLKKLGNAGYLCGWC
jgi:ribose 5-phosphate isomerase A